MLFGPHFTLAQLRGKHLAGTYGRGETCGRLAELATAFSRGMSFRAFGDVSTSLEATQDAGFSTELSGREACILLQ